MKKTKKTEPTKKTMSAQPVADGRKKTRVWLRMTAVQARALLTSPKVAFKSGTAAYRRFMNLVQDASVTAACGFRLTEEELGTLEACARALPEYRAAQPGLLGEISVAKGRLAALRAKAGVKQTPPKAPSLPDGCSADFLPFVLNGSHVDALRGMASFSFCCPETAKGVPAVGTVAPDKFVVVPVHKDELEPLRKLVASKVRESVPLRLRARMTLASLANALGAPTQAQAPAAQAPTTDRARVALKVWAADGEYRGEVGLFPGEPVAFALNGLWALRLEPGQYRVRKLVNNKIVGKEEPFHVPKISYSSRPWPFNPDPAAEALAFVSRMKTPDLRSVEALSKAVQQHTPWNGKTTCIHDPVEVEPGIFQYAPRMFVWFDEVESPGGAATTLEAARAALKKHADALPAPKTPEPAPTSAGSSVRARVKVAQGPLSGYRSTDGFTADELQVVRRWFLAKYPVTGTESATVREVDELLGLLGRRSPPSEGLTMRTIDPSQPRSSLPELVDRFSKAADELARVLREERTK